MNPSRLIRFLPVLMLGGMILEIAVMIAVGRLLGVFPTLGLLFLAAILGGMVMKQAGLGLAAMGRGGPARQFESDHALARFLLFIAGMLFIVPGFVSDGLGLILLLPPVRLWLARRLLRGIDAHVEVVRQDFRRSNAPGPIIEGEAVEIDIQPKLPREDRPPYEP